MLRVVLGICGVGLIAFGVFGGKALENMHRGISGIFTPDTIVLEDSGETVNPVTQPAVQVVVEETTDLTPVAAVEDNSATDASNNENMIVLASSEGSSAEVLQTEAIAAETVVEIKTASNDDSLLEEIQPALLNGDSTVIAADTLATASNAVAKSPSLPAVEDLKAEGVAVVLTATTGVPPNDTLFVLKERVNMREGPSTGHPIVLQLEQGQELMEFKRDGKWVHVGAYGTSGKIGWVHNTLVGSQ